MAGLQATGGAARSGTGGALVVSPPSNAPGGLYTAGTEVSFVPAPDPDFDLLSWGGHCGGAGEACRIKIANDLIVSVVFIKLPQLVINDFPVTGGSVSLSNGSLNIKPAPNASGSRFRAGTQITITAEPAAGYGILSWTGACTPTPLSCTIIADSDKTLRVTFAPITLTLNSNLVVVTTENLVPNGLVKVSPGPNAPNGRFIAGTEVTLTAVPNQLMKFKAWTGACAGQGAVCKLILTQAVETLVEFEPQ